MLRVGELEKVRGRGGGGAGLMRIVEAGGGGLRRRRIPEIIYVANILANN